MNSSHDGKMKIAFSGRSRITPCASTSDKSLPCAQKRDGRALGDFHFDLIRQRAPDHGVFDPRNRFDLRAALVERNAQNAVAAVGAKNLEHAGAGQRNDFLSTSPARDGSALFQDEASRKCAKTICSAGAGNGNRATPNVTRRYVFQAFLPNLRRLISSGFCRRRYFGSSSARISCG